MAAGHHGQRPWRLAVFRRIKDWQEQSRQKLINNKTHRPTRIYIMFIFRAWKPLVLHKYWYKTIETRKSAICPKVLIIWLYIYPFPFIHAKEVWRGYMGTTERLSGWLVGCSVSERLRRELHLQVLTDWKETWYSMTIKCKCSRDIFLVWTLRLQLSAFGSSGNIKSYSVVFYLFSF